MRLIFLFFMLIPFSAHAEDNFFPVTPSTEFLTGHLTKELIILGESKLTQSEFNLRFLYFRSFHRPVSVRVNCNEKCNLVSKTKETIIQNNLPTETVVKKTYQLTDDEALRLRALTKDASLSTKAKEYTEGICVDGASWTVEAYLNNNYHFKSTNSCSISKNIGFQALSKFLLSISKVQIDKELLY